MGCLIEATHDHRKSRLTCIYPKSLTPSNCTIFGWSAGYKPCAVASFARRARPNLGLESASRLVKKQKMTLRVVFSFFLAGPAGYKFLHSRLSASSGFLAGSKTPNFCITKIEAKIASLFIL